MAVAADKMSFTNPPLMGEFEEEKAAQSILPDVATELVKLRKEAVDARSSSGIEGRWQYAIDAYNGEDEATKAGKRLYKPSTLDGPFIENDGTSWRRSTAYTNLTRPYVDSAAARVGDMLFPVDDRNWEYRPTPKQDIEEMLDTYMLMGIPQEGALQLIAQQAQLDAETIMDAQRQTDDWLNECKWNALGRQLIHDAARLGTGVVKGPVSMKINGKIQPGSKLVDVRNCFPDPACGDDIHNGDFFWEKEDIPARKLRDKITIGEAEGWIPESIRECLREGPKSYDGIVLEENGRRKKSYELWYYQGEITVDALLECGCIVQDDAAPRIWANVTLCNDYIIRMSVAPLQDCFSYNMLRWQKREGYWAGIGVGEQMETPQRGINAAVRNLFDNAALTALPQIIYWKGKIKPKNSRYELEPGKVWEVADDELTFQDVKNAIMTIEIPSKQAELLKDLDTMRGLAQETTGLPLIIQGQASSGVVGSDQLQTNAATVVLRRIAKDFDDDVTVPHLTGYYNWIKDNEILSLPEAAVDARGSSVLVERDIQAQALIQMVHIVANPIYGQDPKLVIEEWMRTQRFDPNKTRLSAEREKELLAAMQKPDEKAQAQVQSAQLRATALTQQAQMEAQTDVLREQSRREEEEIKHLRAKELKDLDMKYELIQYANKKNIDIDGEVRKMIAHYFVGENKGNIPNEETY